MKKSMLSLLPVVLLACLTGIAQCEEEIEVVLDGLKNPCGVAVQPGTGHVFVSDSAAGKIVRVVDGKTEDVIIGSAQDVYGKGPKYDIGPLGITFLDKQRLATGDGGYKDGEEYVRVFKVPEPGQSALSYDEGTTIGPIEESENIKAEGNLYGIVATNAAIFVTCNGDDTKGWVARATVNGTKFGPLERFIATKEAVNVDAPVAITVSPRGEVVVGQMGEISVGNDSLLCFYNANDGKLLMNKETGLHDITDLAYSPKGHLYATDFAWSALDEGGLFRLDREIVEGEQQVSPVKITGLDKPTAMAFGKDGELYITVIGEVDGEEQVGQGQLIKLAPGL